MIHNIKNTVKELRDMSNGYNCKVIKDIGRFNYWITTDNPHHLDFFLDEIIMDKDKDNIYKSLLNLYPMSKNIFIHILEKKKFHSEIENAFPQFEEPLKMLQGLWSDPQFYHYLENSPSLDRLKNQIDKLVKGYESKKESVSKCVIPVLEADLARLQIISDLVEAVKSLEKQSSKNTVVEDITYVKNTVDKLAEQEFVRNAILALRNSLEPKIDKKADEISDEVKGLDVKVQNIIDSIITDNKLNEAYEKIAFQQNILTTINNAVFGEDGEVRKFKKYFEKIEGIAATKDDFNKLDQTFAGSIGDLSIELLGVKDEITNQQNYLQELRDGMKKIQQWQVDFAKNQGEVDKLKEQISNLEKDVKTIENEKIGLDKANIELKNNIDALKNEKEKLQIKFNIWEEREKNYIPVKEALQNCVIFSDFMEERGLCSISDCFPLMLAIGDDLKFAQALHKAAKDSWKAKSRQTIEESNGMTVDEQQVYIALNQCYKSILSIDFDIFALPGGKTIGAPCTDIKFDAKESLNMVDTTKKSYRSVEVVYVPVLRKKDHTVMEYAQVKGTMN